MAFKAWLSALSFFCCRQLDFYVLSYFIFCRESRMPCSLISVIVSFRPGIQVIRPRAVSKDRRTFTQMPDNVKMRTQKSGWTLKIHCAYPLPGVLGLLLQSNCSWKRRAFIRASHPGSHPVFPTTFPVQALPAQSTATRYRDLFIRPLDTDSDNMVLQYVGAFGTEGECLHLIMLPLETVLMLQ